MVVNFMVWHVNYDVRHLNSTASYLMACMCVRLPCLVREDHIYGLGGMRGRATCA